MLWDSTRIITGFGGGLIIGLASAIMLLGLGRIAGVSGLTARALGIARQGAPRMIAIAFVIGLPIGAALIAMVDRDSATVRMPASAMVLATAGLLVGYGTRLGSGCTSGHGVCGLSRLSPRSAAATAVFMLAGIMAATCVRLSGILS